MHKNKTYKIVQRCYSELECKKFNKIKAICPPEPQKEQEPPISSCGLLTEFDQNIVLPTFIELTLLPTLLTTVTLNIDDLDDRVWLTGTVQTRVSTGAPAPGFVQIAFQIYRNDPTFTSSIFLLEDIVVNSGFVNGNATTFTFVDLSLPTGVNTYYLTGQILSTDPQATGVFVEKTIFTGAEIEANS
ncbi:hypothetical protein FC756_14235 [Lysinibacillus mangiferihumi]|uniref:Exosporium protein C n=1 Tax=Lysinibacillus mangiferihumi TaxID=1130819 RepID=A0A4U2YZ82_9BACI|nr:hypothetical protein [Lysinibacillus mangiferihumi]TKI66888.1 hypothetical protein FC756_14235 [Lysinibacillus mangiferihumi]